MESLIARLGFDLTNRERDRLVGLASRTRSFSAGDEIVREDVPVDFSTLILEGLSCRQKTFPDGRRQIIIFHVRGDFCDLHSFLLKKMEHSVVALTDCQVALVPHESLRRVIRLEPRLVEVFWSSTMLDAAIHRQWIVSMGRRSAYGRLAHLFCELFVRLRAVGLSPGYEYPLPVTQLELSDAMGISLVHTNRTLAALRDDGLATFAQRTVRIHDWRRLQQAAEFDPSYLRVGA